MPESVPLRFTAPDLPDLTTLRIFEGASAEGPWTLIESVVGIGSYPTYISYYTTDQATSKLNWFAIQWVDASGAETELSNPLQGGTQTLVGEIMALVSERDHTLDQQVLRQETEYAIETYFGIDPYTATTDKYRIKIGLARLIQARVMIGNLARGGGTTSGWTAGLVSLKSGTTAGSTPESLIKWLLEISADMLGLSSGRIAQMAELPIAGGLSRIVTADISRTLIEVE